MASRDVNCGHNYYSRFGRIVSGCEHAHHSLAIYASILSGVNIPGCISYLDWINHQCHLIFGAYGAYAEDAVIICLHLIMWLYFSYVGQHNCVFFQRYQCLDAQASLGYYALADHQW